MTSMKEWKNINIDDSIAISTDATTFIKVAAVTTATTSNVITVVISTNGDIYANLAASCDV